MYVFDTEESDVGIYDRVVIQEILKEIAQTQQVDLNAKQRFKGVNDARRLDCCGADPSVPLSL